MKEFRGIAASVLCLVMITWSGWKVVEAKEETESQLKTSEKSPQNKSQPSFHYVGNSFSAKFHKPECEFVRKMRSEHVKLLKSKEEGTFLRYLPCNWCLPSWDKSVAGKIVKPSQ
ncbi:hypothetical protein GC174_12785 [bacterium]|nr:hypothetical protein [bacterium]